MRMRYWALAAVAVLAVGGLGRAVAQKPGEPAVEVRLRSVNDLLTKAEYIGGLIDQEDPVQQVKGLVQQLSGGGKGVEGIDPAKPFGVYAIVAEDVANSPVVVLIPVADKDTLLTALKERANIEAKKADGGLYTVEIPVPQVSELVIKFADGYAYVARDARHLAAGTLVPAKTFFAKDDGSVLSVVARLDRIPADLKALVLGQMEHQVQEQLRNQDADKPAAQKKLEAIFADAFAGGTKMLVEDGQEVSLKLFVDPKTDELSAEFGMSAKDGTPLAKTFAGLAGKTSRAAGVVATKDPVARASFKGGLPEDLNRRLAPVVDKLVEEAVNQAKDGDRAAVRKVFDALLPTLKGGQADGAFSFAGPDAGGKYALLAAFAVKEGKGVEKVVKELAPFAPADEVTFDFDVETVGAFTLHKVTLKKDSDDFDRVFGTRTVWLATSDDLLALSIEPDGKALRAGLKAPAAAVPLVSVEAALAKVVPLAEKGLKPDELKAAIKEAFGGASPAGKDTVTVTVEGGKQLTARLKVKGKAVRLGAMMGELRGK